MDGTFFVSDALLPNAREFLEELRRRDFPFVFLTNNSSRRAADYQAKLSRLGIEVRTERILTSGEATIHHLLAETPHRKVFLMGTPSLEQEFLEAGLVLTETDPDCVVLGFDQTLTYEKLTTACLLLARGLPYFATHPDFTCITDEGLIPDTGAMMAAIECVTHRTPKVIGKPQPEMVAAALARLGSTADRTAMVGDQLDTDATMAMESGLFGVLVLSGETSRQRLESQSSVRPDMVVDHIGVLYERLKSRP
jgi:HAD superfamily hydrolase (TIGR01450 family)